MREIYKEALKKINAGAGNKILAKIAECEEIIIEIQAFLNSEREALTLSLLDKKTGEVVISSAKKRIKALHGLYAQKSRYNALRKMKKERKDKAEDAKLIGLGINLAMKLNSNNNALTRQSVSLAKASSKSAFFSEDVANDNSEEMRIIRATALKNMNIEPKAEPEPEQSLDLGSLISIQKEQKEQKEGE